MSFNSNHVVVFDQSALTALACPVCYQSLRYDLEMRQIRCQGCGKAYPVTDGIPVLIPGRAVAQD